MTGLLNLSPNVSDDFFYYLQWKKSYSIVRRFPLCALCEMLHSSNLPQKTYDNLHRWWFGKSNDYCIDGKDMPYEI